MTDEQIAEIRRQIKHFGAEDWELITLGEDVKKYGHYVQKPYVGAVAVCPKVSPIYSAHPAYLKFIAESGRNIAALLADNDRLRGELRHIDGVLARRPALEGTPNRVDKILHALATAAKAEP